MREYIVPGSVMAFVIRARSGNCINILLTGAQVRIIHPYTGLCELYQGRETSNSILKMCFKHRRLHSKLLLFFFPFERVVKVEETILECEKLIKNVKVTH